MFIFTLYVKLASIGIVQSKLADGFYKFGSGLKRIPLFSFNEKVLRAVRDAIYMKGDMKLPQVAGNSDCILK